MVKLYLSLVSPRPEYEYPAWSPLYMKYQHPGERQEASHQDGSCAQGSSFEERVNSLKLPSLFYRRARGDTIEMYKHVSGLYTIEPPYIRLEELPNETR